LCAGFFNRERNKDLTMTSIPRHVCQTIAAATVLAMPVTSHADPLKELSAQWWQWALSIPSSVNPLADATGANCMVGQRDDVWFLAGSFGGGTTSRRCSVPQGVPLFFPIVNSVNVNTPHVCGQKGPLSVAELRALVAPFIDTVSGLTATLDSRALKGVRRIQSVPFVTALPMDNIFVGPCGGKPQDSPAGIFSPSVDDGYYVLLEGLSAGVHTLQFTAANTDFNVNVTYTLDVIPVKLK
jgi:hypothetical protein